MESQDKKISLEILERRDWQLWLLAILMILVLSIAMLSVMYPTVFWLGDEMQTNTPKVFFGGLCVLLTLTIVYLIQKQVQLRKLKKEFLQLQTALAMAAGEAAIVESTDDAIFCKNLDGIILTWNQGAEELYGYTADEVKGRHTSMLIPTERSNYLQQNLENLLQGKSLKHYQSVSIRKDGTSIPVTLTISPLRGAKGTIVGSSTIARDLSARLRVENELKNAHQQLQISLTELERRNRWLDLFQQMTELLESAETPDEGYAVVVDFVKQIFPTDSGALFLLNQSKSIMEAYASWGESLASEVAFSVHDCWAMRLGKKYVSEAGQTSRACKHILQPVSASMVCSPLVAQGEVSALLFLKLAGCNDSEEDESAEQLLTTKLKVANTFSERISVLLANLRLREQLRLQSIRDPLTGLFNRRYLDETLERELSRLSRKGSTLGIIMLDIDHFKDFNDRYGHDGGDALLREVGHLLTNKTRKQDVACRYGGEEFTILLPDASLEDTALRAEQLMVQAREIHVEYQGQRLGSISFSLGVAAFPGHGTSADNLLKEADKALYRAKAEGRDRVGIA